MAEGNPNGDVRKCAGSHENGLRQLLVGRAGGVDAEMAIANCSNCQLYDLDERGEWRGGDSGDRGENLTHENLSG